MAGNGMKHVSPWAAEADTSSCAGSVLNVEGRLEPFPAFGFECLVYGRPLPAVHRGVAAKASLR